MKQLTKAIIETIVAFLMFIVGLGVLFAGNYSPWFLFGSLGWSLLMTDGSPFTFSYGVPYMLPIMLILSFVVFATFAFIALRTAHKNDVLQAQLDQFN
jgi:hypothetical protein